MTDVGGRKGGDPREEEAKWPGRRVLNSSETKAESSGEKRQMDKQQIADWFAGFKVITCWNKKIETQRTIVGWDEESFYAAILPVAILEGVVDDGLRVWD